MKKILFLFVLLSVTFIFGCGSNELNDTFVIKEINLEMIKCPAGSFMMGSPDNELGRRKGETLHKVTFSKPFYIGKYEVTQSQYVALMEKNPSDFSGAYNPVENVSYRDAKNFCDKLNLKYLKQLPRGYKFDLPTEAQWEYACRAGTSTALNNGKNLIDIQECENLDEVGWYDRNSGYTTHEVGQKKPNAWGIYDMHGNVAEWCRDRYGKYPNEDVIDPEGTNNGWFNVVRGGFLNEVPECCRSAFRNWGEPSQGIGTIGFRVALVPIN